MDLIREIIYLTRYVPKSKFMAFRRIIPFLVDPILDLGCHIGDTFYYMKFKGNIVGVDIYSEYFRKCWKRNIYSNLIKMNLLNLSESFGKFGCITCFFCLEHLFKKDGLKLLDKMAILGKNNVILVPLGYSHQESPDDNSFQKHLSSWMPEDFINKDFEIIICNALSFKRFPFYKVILGVRTND